MTAFSARLEKKKIEEDAKILLKNKRGPPYSLTFAISYYYYFCNNL